MAALANSVIADLDDALADFDLSGATPAEAAPVVRLAAAPATVAAASPPPANERDAFYSSLEAKEAEELQAIAARIKEHDRAYRAGCLEIGKELIRIKDSIPGHFDRWLKVEFNLSKATAWNYINAAQEFGDVPKVVEILPPATVYKLAAKATPDDVRKAVVLEINAGAVPSKREVEDRIAEARRKAAEEDRTRKHLEREQADAERQQREDEGAWRVRAKELADAGKTEAEIEKDRRKWISPSAKNERAKEARRKAKQKREEERQKEQEAWNEERQLKRQNARAAAEYIRKTLGDDFEAFRSLIADANVIDFKEAIAAMKNEENV